MVQHKILIIDDDAASRTRLRLDLEAHGWLVTETSKETNVVDVARRHTPDLILLDVSRAGFTTEEVAKQLKLDPLTYRIPIIVLTAVSRPQGSLEPWAADAVTTNVQAPTLRATLQRTLAQRTDAKPFVLVVDDEPDLVEILTALLNARGFSASGALDGVEALDVIRSVRPDVILLDLDMPRMNGWEVLQRMKASDAWNDIAVVILTGKDQSAENRRQAKSWGVAEYLLKPCSPEEIVRAIRSALGTSLGPRTT